MKLNVNSAKVLITDEMRNNPDKPIDLRALGRQAYQAEQAAIAQQKLDKEREELKEKYSYIFNELESRPYLSSTEMGSEGDKLNYLFQELVPSQGKAETVAGEIARAMMRVLYRLWNDGDICFIGYGIETAASDMAYLCETLGDLGDQMYRELESLADSYQGSWNMEAFSSKYQDIVVDFANRVVDYIMDHPELIAEPNEDDSRMWDESEIADLQPLEDYDVEIPDGVLYHIEEGHIDYSDVEWEASTWVYGVSERDIHCDRYSVIFENCTPEVVDELDQSAYDCMMSYQESLDSEYGSEEDNYEEDEEEWEEEE